MNTIKSRISRLIKILGYPHFEILGDFVIDGNRVDCMIAVDNDFELSIFNGDFETIVLSSQLDDKQLQELVEYLEYLLINY